MASISLEAAIRTCKVDTAYANKVQSDRFLSPSLMVCPVWNGVDTTGRQVCPDSFYTKNAGCNSAEDRVFVENNLRPQYMEYINLSANGIDAAIYGNSMPYNEVGQTNAELDAANNITGNFGLQFGANTYPGCNYYPYEQAMTQEQKALAQEKQKMMHMEKYTASHMAKNSATHVQASQMGQHPAKGAMMKPAPQIKMDKRVMVNSKEHMEMKDMQMGQQPNIIQRHPDTLNHLSHQQIPIEGFKNLSRNPQFAAASQHFAQNQQNFRQQGALNNGFTANNFRVSGGN